MNREWGQDWFLLIQLTPCHLVPFVGTVCLGKALFWLQGGTAGGGRLEAWMPVRNPGGHVM